MSSKESALVLLPQTEVETTHAVVGDENFHDFLIGFNDYFPYNSWEFSKNLNLSYFNELFQLITNEKTEVTIPPYVYKKNFKDTYMPKQNEATGQDKAEEIGYAERSSTVYFDACTEESIYTPIQHGEYAQVTTETLKRMSNTLMPMLEVHTHPDNSLFSAQDYRRLITKGYLQGRRVVQGIVVICPDIQILALPNPTTPVLSLKKASQMLDGAAEAFDLRLRHIDINRINRIKKTSRLSISRVRKYQAKMAELIGDIVERREFDGAITQAEGTELRDDLNLALDLIMGEEASRYLDKVDRTDLFYRNRIAGMENYLKLEIAREIDVQLFSSTDMANFTKWTA